MISSHLVTVSRCQTKEKAFSNKQMNLYDAQPTSGFNENTLFSDFLYVLYRMFLEYRSILRFNGIEQVSA